MLTLTIQGKDVAELYANVANMLVLMARGGNSVFAQPQSAAEVPAETPAPGEAVAEENPPVVEKPANGKKPKAPRATIDIVAEPNLGADIEDPLGLGDVKPANNAVEYTIEDCKKRVNDILLAHGPKTKESPDGRGNSMPDTIAYIRKLFVPFNIKKAIELKPEQFAPFMAQSLPYLNGTAK